MLFRSHEGGFKNVLPVSDRLLYERHGNVVRQIADKMERLSGKLKVKGVGFNDFDVWGHIRPEPGNQIFIDLHGNDAMRRQRQFSSKGSGARPDFHHGVPRLDAGERNNLAQDVGVGKEVLSEAFFHEKKKARGVTASFQASRTGFEPVLQP